MRRAAIFPLSFAAALAAPVAGAQASSFVAPEQASGGTSSIVVAGSAKAGPANPQSPTLSVPDVLAADRKIEPGLSSPSVLVLGAPAVTDEKVSAIPDKRNGPRGVGPMVIRGGIVGGASAANPAAVAAPAAAAAPQAAQAPLPPNGEQEPKTLREAVDAAR